MLSHISAKPTYSWVAIRHERSKSGCEIRFDEIRRGSAVPVVDSHLGVIISQFLDSIERVVSSSNQYLELELIV